MGCAFPGVSFQWGSVIGVPSVSLSVPCVTCQRLSIIGVPSVSLSGPSVFFSACWLPCFEARRSAGACGCMRTDFYVCSLFMPSIVWRALFLLCFCVPPPLPCCLFFLFLFLLPHWLIQCDGCSGCWRGGRGARGLGQKDRTTCAGREGHWGGLPSRAEGLCIVRGEAGGGW